MLTRNINSNALVKWNQRMVNSLITTQLYFACVRHYKGCSGRAVSDNTIDHVLSNFVITSEHSNYLWSYILKISSEAKNRIIADSTQIIAENPRLIFFTILITSGWPICKSRTFSMLTVEPIMILKVGISSFLTDYQKNSCALGFWKFVEMIGEEAVEEQHIIGCLRNGISVGSR